MSPVPPALEALPDTGGVKLQIRRNSHLRTYEFHLSHLHGAITLAMSRGDHVYHVRQTLAVTGGRITISLPAGFQLDRGNLERARRDVVKRNLEFPIRF